MYICPTDAQFVTSKGLFSFVCKESIYRTAFFPSLVPRRLISYEKSIILNPALYIYIIIRDRSAFSLVASCVLLKYTRTDDVN